MARYDKYDPISGGFRAPLAANLAPNGSGEYGPVAVSLDANGRVVAGTAGQSGCCGVLVKNAPRTPFRLGGYQSGPGAVNAAVPMGLMAGDIVDVMTAGEIVEITGFTAGQGVYAQANGVLTAVAAGNIKVGFMVEATRMIVRLGCNTAVG